MIIEKKLLNRKTYKAIKRMDREKMESFIAIANVYHEGFKDGSEAGKKADFKIQLSEVLNKTKGIGPKLYDKIMETAKEMGV